MPPSLLVSTLPVEGLGNLALDFLHTLHPHRGGPSDDLDTPQALLTWLRDRSLGAWTSNAEISPSDARTLFDEARRLRAEVGALVEAHHRRRAVPEWARFGVDRVLAAAPWTWRLADAPEGVALDSRPAGSRPLALLGPLALAAARIVTTVPAERLRPCASPRCGAWFIDTSKGGRRRWCSMSRCGNREKAAIHRAKVARG